MGDFPKILGGFPKILGGFSVNRLDLRHPGLTMQILDSMVAERSTLEKMVLASLSYLKETPLSIRIGGESFSTSGNRRTTSLSFSTGFSSGLKLKKRLDFRKRKQHDQLLEPGLKLP